MAFFDFCYDCINNTGGACCYDIELEAKEEGVKPEELCNANYCVFAETYEEAYGEYE